jgi:hypothetical protein
VQAGFEQQIAGEMSNFKNKSKWGKINEIIHFDIQNYFHIME